MHPFEKRLRTASSLDKSRPIDRQDCDLGLPCFERAFERRDALLGRQVNDASRGQARRRGLARRCPDLLRTVRAFGAWDDCASAA